MPLPWIWILLPVAVIGAVAAILASVCVCLRVRAGSQGERLEASLEARWCFLRVHGSVTRLAGGQNQVRLSLWGRTLVRRDLGGGRIVGKGKAARGYGARLLGTGLLVRLFAPLRRLALAIRWEEVRVFGRVGFDDPAVTGVLTGIAQALDGTVGMARLPVHLEIEPDFEAQGSRVESAIGCSFRPYRVLAPLAQVAYILMGPKR